MEGEFRRWEGEYNQAAVGFRVCERIYGEEEPCEQLKMLVALHDQLCQVNSTLPLA